MNADAKTVMRRLASAWESVHLNMQRMVASSSIRPANHEEVFAWVSDAASDQVKFVVRPFVINVPEKATLNSLNLYIAVSGWISFEKISIETKEKFRTSGFGTKVGYFRWKERDGFQHVYGAHYDIDEESPGHPVFHGQMRSQSEFAGNIRDLFLIDGSVDNRVAKILRNVRVPTAQMDIFSVIMQICADHLMSKESSGEVKQAFKSLREYCDFFIGVAHRLAYLNATSASSCYRSTHWYDAPSIVSPPT